MSTENISFSFRLHSHPDKLLKDHLWNVGTTSKEIADSKQIENGDTFSEIAYLIGISHDFGKATTYFQKWLNRDEKTQYARHSYLSALFGYFLVKHYLMKENKLNQLWYLPGIAWLAIVKHHSNIRNLWDEEAGQLESFSEIEIAKSQLEDISNNNIEEMKEFYSFLDYISIQDFLEQKDNLEDYIHIVQKDIKKITRKSFRNELPVYYFYILFFYSILLDADKLDASGRLRLPERLEIESDIIENYKKRKFKEKQEGINLLREKAYREIISSLDNLKIEENRILSINLPTGMGKTLTGLSFAIKMRNKIHREIGFSPKIIYALPFLSIIDQNASQIEEFLTMENNNTIPSNLFLKHHHLADVEYKEESEGELAYEEFNRSLLLTEGWHSEIVITTFVQLFHSLITNRNRAARKFHNMTNSIILLDEVQAIPPKFWYLVRIALEYLAYYFNSWIILMTATQPLIFLPNAIKEIVPDKIQYFQILDRVNYSFDMEKREFDSFKEEFLHRILDDTKRSYMVILNTIGSCKELYEYLKEELCREYGFTCRSENILDENGICVFPSFLLLNLSTHVLPRYRLKRIKRIKSRDSTDRVVIITTQLVEAGVDIDVDVVYRDLAPLDCIVQAGGRCNRNNSHEKGEVNVINLIDNSKSSRPFWSFIYDSLLIDATEKSVKKFSRSVCESEFVTGAMKEYYGYVLNWISGNISRNIIESIKKLNFSEISEFRLIEDTRRKISILIEIDDRAERTRKRMEEIVAGEKGFRRKMEIRKIRNEINSCTICTYPREKIDYLKNINGFEDYFYVKRKELDSWYKKDTGLYLESEDSGLFIL